MATPRRQATPPRYVKSPLKTLEAGYWVAMGVAQGAAPGRCYVGQIQAIDAYGVQITLVDWLSGQADNWDVFVPWPCVQAVLIATPAHDRTRFRDAASEWQSTMHGPIPEVRETDEAGHPL